MLGLPGSSARRRRPSGSITICPLSTASSILPIFTSDLDRRGVRGLLDVGCGHHAKSARLMPRVRFGSTPAAQSGLPERPEPAHPCPLRRIPAIVSFLNPQPALSLVGGNHSSCPFSAIADGIG